VHTLVLLAAGLALCYRDSINLTQLNVRAIKAKPQINGLPEKDLYIASYTYLFGA
jgi:hypothetical protein